MIRTVTYGYFAADIEPINVIDKFVLQRIYVVVSYFRLVCIGKRCSQFNRCQDRSVHAVVVTGTNFVPDFEICVIHNLFDGGLVCLEVWVKPCVFIDVSR